MTREEHLAWCKKRALEYLEAGEFMNAWASMASDMSKHPETSGHLALELGTALLLNGHLSTQTLMREFIEGFN